MTPTGHPPALGVGHQPVEATLDQCIKCNICVTVCPVTAVTDLFPGPKYEGPQAGRFRHGAQPAPDHSVDYCSGCRVCNMACPTGVKIAEINARARARLVEDGQIAGRRRLRNNLIARPGTMGRLGGPVAPLANWAFRNRATRWIVEKTFDIHRSAPLPVFSGERFTTWLKRRRPEPGSGSAGRVAYFPGCTADRFEPRVARTSVRVLERLGFEVEVTGGDCCGLPLLSNGELPAARAYHRRVVDSLAGFADDGVPVVGSSTSCTLTLKEEAPELLDVYDDDAMAVAGATWDIHEFLVGVVEKGGFPTGLRPIPLRVVYHPPCQYRGHRIGLPALDMMELIPGLEVVESGAACCGVAGSYGYKEEKYDIAMAVGQPLFEKVAEVGGPLTVCDAETCRWQIAAATGVPSVQPIELVAYALGVDEPGPVADAVAAVDH